LSLRLFIAGELDEPVIAALGQVQQQLRRRLGSAALRWTDPRGTHLTLKFLGDTEERRLPELECALTDVARAHAPMLLQVGGLGVFPNLRRPRVIWVGLQGATAELSALQAAVEKAMCHLGLPPEERGFSPHLTLARVRDAAASSDYDAIAAAVRDMPAAGPTALRVDSVSLMRSVLRPEGAQYSRRFSARLGQ